MDEKLLKKLNFKEGDNTLIIYPPENYLERIEGLNYDTSPSGTYNFVQIFVYKREEIPNSFKIGTENLSDSGKLWFCYAKKSSELYTDVTRDEGWDIAEKYNFIAVRQVAIDDDWSALRFKPVEDVKQITRKSGRGNEEPKEIFLPSSLQKALNSNPFCKHTFNNLSYTNRKEYVDWVTSAKTEETGKKRLEQMIEKLKAGKKNPSGK